MSHELQQIVLLNTSIVDFNKLIAMKKITQMLKFLILKIITTFKINFMFINENKSYVYFRQGTSPEALSPSYENHGIACLLTTDTCYFPFNALDSQQIKLVLFTITSLIFTVFSFSPFFYFLSFYIYLID